MDREALRGLARRIEGELRADLDDRVEKNGLGGRVIFTGIRDDIPRLFGIFDIFVLPSLWEGQPITIMEAMASGRPIVATDVGGNSEILRLGELGLLVPAKNPDAITRAVDRLLGDQSMAEDLGNRARAHATAELNSASMTRRYEEVFISCLRGQRISS